MQVSDVSPSHLPEPVGHGQSEAALVLVVVVVEPLGGVGHVPHHLVYRGEEVEVGEEPDHLTGDLAGQGPGSWEVGVQEDLGGGCLSLV